MIPWSSPSIRGGRADWAPAEARPRPACANRSTQSEAISYHCAAHSVNVGPLLELALRMLGCSPRKTFRGGVEVARTPQAQHIADAWAEVVESRTTRRELVKRTAVAGGGHSPERATMGRFSQRRRTAQPSPQIAIVGAGLAGLTCALSAETGRAERPRSTRPRTGSGAAVTRSGTSLP